jgi:hypothetical protein
MHPLMTVDRYASARSQAKADMSLADGVSARFAVS